MKKLLTSIASATALLGAFSAPAFAASTFHLVVPLNARTQAQEPVDPIIVSLTGAALPKATVNQAYNHSLQDYLAVTGDKALDKSAARWSLAEGPLPAGLALDATTGAVAGTPTAKTTSPTSFTVLSSYKGSDGQAVYTIEVGGVPLQVSKIATGQGHTCAVTPAGGVKCWGFNVYGQLGNGAKTNSLTPVAVTGLDSGIEAVYLGAYHSCAIKTDGAVKCWGYNNAGQLGDNSITDRLVPVDANLGSGPVALALGYSHTCALMADKSVKCWGENSQGELGNGSTTDNRIPTSVVGLAGPVASLSSGMSHVCVLTEAGSAQCWGGNGSGQVGSGSTTNRSTPYTITSLGTEVRSIAAGSYHSCAVISDGSVKCWGFGGNYQLGNNSTSNRTSPGNVSGMSNAVSVHPGYNHSCAIKADNTVWCWGWNGDGQLGVGGVGSYKGSATLASNLTPGSGIITSASANHNCAIEASGVLNCWGDNYYGQLGNGRQADSSTPVEVQGVK